MYTGLLNLISPSHYMRDHACCLTPILQGRRVFLKVWRLDFLVIRVCYVSVFEIGKWILRLGVQRVSGGHNVISSCGICMFGVAQACAAPQNNAKSLHWSSKAHDGRLWAMVRTKTTRTRTCHNLECDPQTHVELPTLKSTFRFQISRLERN